MLISAVTVLCAVLLPAAEAPATDTPIELLNADTYWRLHLAWRTPQVATASGELKPLLEKKRRGLKEADRKPVPAVHSPLPPAGWAASDFDDRSWARDLLPVEFPQAPKATVYVPGNPMEWQAVAARGKFLLADPSGVGDLRLSVAYAGGVVVYVNGRELARGHLPTGKLAPETLAERYADEAYLTPDGHKLPLPRDGKDYADRYAKRIRRLADVPVPASMLRNGVNVLAIEARRAPLSEAWLTAAYGKVSHRGAWGPFGHVGLFDVKLTAAKAAGAAANTARPAGMQLWTCGAFENLLVWQHGDPCERPLLKLTGVRNGAFSGRIVVGSTKPIRGVKVAPGELSAGPARIPASAVQVRYAALSSAATSWVASRASSGTARFDMLLDKPPAEVPVVDLPVPKRSWRLQWSHPHGRPVPGAVLPIWVTVHVPAAAKPGVYEGKVRVSADGLAPVDVPVRLAVHDWPLPSPRDFVSHNNLWPSHESTALHYGAGLWSDRHFELMGHVLELSNLAANKFCVLHLVCEAYHMGNRESMVRWIDAGGGRYRHDFSILDRYLDLYASACGRPGLLLLSVFVPRADQVDKKTSKPARWCKVSRLDPKTGTVTPMAQPAYGTPESAAFWRPVLAAIRKRLLKRGWWGVTALGTGSDVQPRPETVAAFREIWPDGVWMSSSHMRPRWYPCGESDRVPVPYRESVWGTGSPYDPEGRRPKQYPRPWKTDGRGREWAFPRVGQGVCSALYDSSRLVLVRAVQEGTLQGGINGFGRIGADFLPIPDPRRDGRFLSLCGPIGAHLGPSASTRAIVAPGPKGIVATERLEMFREGLQVREAMISIQKAIDGGRLPAELARQCTKLLNDRARTYLRTHPDTPAAWTAFECGLLERDDRLFALCAEAAAATGRAD